MAILEAVVHGAAELYHVVLRGFLVFYFLVGKKQYEHLTI